MYVQNLKVKRNLEKNAVILSGLNAAVAKYPAQISVLKSIFLGCSPVSSKFELKWHIV